MFLTVHLHIQSNNLELAPKKHQLKERALIVSDFSSSPGQTLVFPTCRKLSHFHLQLWLAPPCRQSPRLDLKIILKNINPIQSILELHRYEYWQFQVTTAPKSATKVPADTSVFMPVLPEAVPMFAQVRLFSNGNKKTAPGSSSGSRWGRQVWESRFRLQQGSLLIVITVEPYFEKTHIFSWSYKKN